MIVNWENIRFTPQGGIADVRQRNTVNFLVQQFMMAGSPFSTPWMAKPIQQYVNRQNMLIQNFKGQCWGDLQKERIRVDTEFRVQMFGATENMPSNNLNTIWSEIVTGVVYDDTWKAIFRIAPTTRPDTGYDVVTMDTTNVTMSQKEKGEKVDYRGIEGTSYRVYYAWYGDGIAISLMDLKTNQWMSIERNLGALRNAAYKKPAEVAYALIEALSSSIDVDWQAPDPADLLVSDEAYTAARDAQTILAGIQQIDTALEGSDTLVNAQYLLVCHKYDVTRYKRALNYMVKNTGGVRVLDQYQITIVPTTNFTVSTYSYLTIAGGENTGSFLMVPTFFRMFNQDNLSEQIAGWLACAFDIGNSGQWARLKKAAE